MSFHYFPKIVTDGLIFYVDASNPKSYDTTGTTWNDISRNNNNGVLTNGPTYNSSNLGNIVFDGTNDFVQFNSIPILQFTNTQPYSISMWFYWTPSTTNFYTVFSYGDVAGLFPTTGDKAYYIMLDSGVLSTQSFLFDYYDGSAYKSLQGNVGVVPQNSWVNFVATSGTINSTAGMKVYINGNLARSFTRFGSGSPSSINYTGCNVNIAARDSTTFFNGKIASTMVYNKELSSDEVYMNYLAMKGRFNL